MRCDQQDHVLTVLTSNRARLIANLLFVYYDVSVPPSVPRRTFETLIHAFVCKKQKLSYPLAAFKLYAEDVDVTG
jgi:hypothetical protein